MGTEYGITEYATIGICLLILALIAHDVIFQRKSRRMVQRRRNKSLEDTLTLLGLGNRRGDK